VIISFLFSSLLFFFEICPQRSQRSLPMGPDLISTSEVYYRSPMCRSPQPQTISRITDAFVNPLPLSGLPERNGVIIPFIPFLLSSNDSRVLLEAQNVSRLFFSQP